MSTNPYLSLYNKAKGATTVPDTFRGFFGGNVDAVDPMIKGFGMVFFTKLPAKLADPNTTSVLTALATSVNIPDGQLEMIEYAARDGGKWYVPGNFVMSGNSITIHFWEMLNLPIYNTFASWISMIRSAHYGYMADVEWKQSEYKGKLIYAVCDPNLKVRFAKAYSGIVPKSIKDDSFNSEIGTQEKIEYDIEFQFDHYPYTSEAIISSAQSWVNKSKNLIKKSVELRMQNAAS